MGKAFREKKLSTTLEPFRRYRNEPKPRFWAPTRIQDADKVQRKSQNVKWNQTNSSRPRI
jgi:hypothetical protein